MRGTPLPPTPRGLAELPEAARAQALLRWQNLRPHLEDGVPLTSMARDAGVPLRTAQRWLARYRADGLAGLARPTRTDHGLRRMPGELQLLIEGLALRRPAPSAAHVHRVVAGVAKDQGWPVPSYATVYAIVRGIDPAMRTLASDGEKRYREVFDLIHRREAAGPNEIWQADHTELDLWVIAPSGKPARPWLTVIEDDHSRAIAGYAVNLGAPSAIQTALALRQAIWRKSEPGWHVCGIPGTFYTDHGSDFTSHHLEQVAADLKIRLMFSGKGRPRGRGKIERYFSTINQMCLPTLPGFVQPDGQPWHPEAVTSRFESLVRDAGLPPIRLHDLRHCAATFLKAAGADLKDVQELLGHSSITITGDTYTSVIAELDVERAKAEAAAELVPRRRRPAA